MRRLVILVAMFLVGVATMAQAQEKALTRDSLLHQMRSKAHLQAGVPLLITFLDIGECAKCSYGLQATIDSAQKLTPTLDNVAVVDCLRDLDLRAFVRQTEWPYATFRNDGSVKEELGIPASTRLALISAADTVVSTIPRDAFNPVAFTPMHAAFAKMEGK